MIPSWSQLVRRVLTLWRLRKVTFNVCPGCGMPFQMNGEGRDTATMTPCEIRIEGGALCGECTSIARTAREKARKRGVLVRGLQAVSSYPDGGYEPRQLGMPIRVGGAPAAGGRMVSLSLAQFHEAAKDAYLKSRKHLPFLS